MIRTDWFPGTEKPGKPGVYERLYEGHICFAKWDGEVWGETWWKREQAERNPCIRGLFQALQWRGIVPEVLGCVPVSQDAAHGCCGCAFEKNLRACEASINAIRCDLERIIWRPRAEVAP